MRDNGNIPTRTVFKMAGRMFEKLDTASWLNHYALIHGTASFIVHTVLDVTKEDSRQFMVRHAVSSQPPCEVVSCQGHPMSLTAEPGFQLHPDLWQTQVLR